MTGNSDEQSPDTERDRLDSTGEFFSVGTPLHAVRAGYVQRPADDVIYENAIAGRYAHVIAADRSGKSSLVAASAARLENNGFKVAILDLEQIGDRDAGSDAGRWYYSVAYRLLRQLRIRVDLQSWWQDKSMLGNRQRLLEFYSEIILPNIADRIVIFVDEIQCIHELPFADELLASIRSAHNARATDPDFSRLTFVLLGECDPLSLISEPDQSPFNITQPVTLGDFSREDLSLFETEINLSSDDARTAVDRIYYWTSGQPYLSQKLARSVARDPMEGDVAGNVDRIVAQQLAGRAALHNEPHLSHIHREIANDPKQGEPLLNLFGRIRKGVSVATDLGSPLQRRLIAVGLVRIDDDGKLAIRNRIYRSVFTARWANDNLPTHWRAPALAAVALLAIVAVPFWYTQLLPQPYVDVLVSDTVELARAEETYVSFRSFPGHSDSAENLYRSFLQRRARAATEPVQMAAIAAMAEELPDAGRMPAELLADFWDRKFRTATRNENRDDALLSVIESLVLSTPQRRNRAAAMVASDYPLLLTSLPVSDTGNVVFNPASMLLTTTRDAEVTQWSMGATGLQRRDDWTITALEVQPLVRRVFVDRQGEVRRIGLTLNISHSRVADLRIKVIAPSGRAVEVVAEVDRASSGADIRIAASQMRDLLGEPLGGTWSLSIRDEEIGVAGILAGWNLQLNSQGAIEDFQRGLNIPDPVERETDNLWLSGDGRYAVARAMQSDSARVWDLAFAKPVRAVAVSEFEQIVGLSAGARMLVTATQETVNLWDTATGNRTATLAVGAASAGSTLTSDGLHLFVQRRSDISTRFELWSLNDAAIAAELEVGGTPALVSLDSRGSRIAIADYDRAVRVWDFRSGELIAQVDLSSQASEIELSAGGDVLGVVSGGDGASLWRVDEVQQPLVDSVGRGRWSLAFSPTGTKALVGRPGYGYQNYDTADGRRLGPLLGAGGDPSVDGLMGFSADEQVVVTGGPDTTARFWRVPSATVLDGATVGKLDPRIWPPSGDAVAVVTPDAKRVAIGDQTGGVRILPITTGREILLRGERDVSFLGHGGPVRRLAVSRDGSLVTSLANDNSIRVWSTADGLPRPFFTQLAGNPVERMSFSPDGSRIGLLSSNRLQVMDTDSGEIVASFELGERHQGVAFAGDNRLYVGSDSGVLRVVGRDANGGWSMRELWQGDASIHWLEASPRSRFLVLVDDNHLARQFSLAEGKLAAAALQLPSAVEEVTFAPGGSRVLFRTSGWVHRASSADSGLIWIDAMLAPDMLDGARMVFGAPDIDDAAALGSRIYLPVAGDQFVSLVEVNFAIVQGPGLFGNKEALLEEWRRKLGLSSAYNL